MNKPKEKQKNIVFSVLLVIPSLLIVIFFLFPMYSSIKLKADEIHATRIKYEILILQRNNLTATKKTYNQIKDNISNISKIFIKKGDILPVVDKLENIANNSGVKQNLSIISPNGKNTEFNISVNGSWENLLSYLGKIEELDYYITIKNPKFIKNKKDDINMTFTAKLYND